MRACEICELFVKLRLLFKPRGDRYMSKSYGVKRFFWLWSSRCNNKWFIALLQDTNLCLRNYFNLKLVFQSTKGLALRCLTDRKNLAKTRLIVLMDFNWLSWPWITVYKSLQWFIKINELFFRRTIDLMTFWKLDNCCHYDSLTTTLNICLPN